jgi:hypothetical protein
MKIFGIDIAITIGNSGIILFFVNSRERFSMKIVITIVSILLTFNCFGAGWHRNLSFHDWPDNLHLYGDDGYSINIYKKCVVDNISSNVCAVSSRVSALESKSGKINNNAKNLSSINTKVINNIFSINNLKSQILINIKNIPDKILNDEKVRESIKTYVAELFEQNKKELEKQILKKHGIVNEDN